MVRADSRQGDKLRGHLRHQPLPLRVESGDVLRENLVASGHRSQRELCRRFYVLGRPTEAKTAYHSYECFRREVAQAPAECLGSGNERGLEEFGRLDTRLHRRAPSAPERPDHPHPAVAALGDARSLARQDRAGCGLRVFGVGVAAARQVTSFGPLDLHNRDPRSLQVAGQLKAP